MAGWVKIYRDIQNSWIWKNESFSRGQAFIDLILMVNHEDKKIMFNGSLLEIKRGSVVTSIRKLGEKWAWSRNKVNHFLEQLESDGMISYKKDTKKTVLTIEKYDLYQSRDFEKSHQKATEEPQKDIKKATEGHQKDTNKNDKEYIKNDKEGKEVVPKVPLSFPTPIHRNIFDIVGEIGYKTWFINSSIEVNDKKIVIITPSDFIRDAINKNYKLRLKELNREIEVKSIND